MQTAEEKHWSLNDSKADKYKNRQRVKQLKTRGKTQSDKP